MLKIFIQNLKNGTHHYEISDDVKNLNWDTTEFFGEVKVNAKISKLENRMTLNANAICKAMLVCDWSLEEFEYKVEADFELEIIETTLLQKESDSKEIENRIIIDKEDKYLDISQVTYEELVLALPMKRIAPKYEGKSFDEEFTQYSAEANKIESENVDQIWSALSKINLN